MPTAPAPSPLMLPAQSGFVSQPAALRHGGACQCSKESGLPILRKREQGDVCAQALLWLPRMVLVCATVAGSQAAAHLLLFPRYHLDNASVLARYPVEQVWLTHSSTPWLGHLAAVCSWQWCPKIRKYVIKSMYESSAPDSDSRGTDAVMPSASAGKLDRNHPKPYKP